MFLIHFRNRNLGIELEYIQGIVKCKKFTEVLLKHSEFALRVLYIGMTFKVLTSAGRRTECAFMWLRSVSSSLLFMLFLYLALSVFVGAFGGATHRMRFKDKSPLGGQGVEILSPLALKTNPQSARC